MKIRVEAEVCTVVEKEQGRNHVLVKSAIWVLGFYADRPPEARTVVWVEGERPVEDAPRDVFDTVMANHSVGISPRERGRYKYAELEGATWRPSEKKLEDLWAERRMRGRSEEEKNTEEDGKVHGREQIPGPQERAPLRGQANRLGGRREGNPGMERSRTAERGHQGMVAHPFLVRQRRFGRRAHRGRLGPREAVRRVDGLHAW